MAAFNVMQATPPAVGDGVTDDTASIASCVLEAAQSGGGRIYFPKPPSVYRVTANLLSFITTQQLGWGFIFEGDGMNSSIIRFDTSAATSPQWLLQTAPNFTSLIGATFRDLGFQGGAPGSNGGWTISQIAPYSNFCQIFGQLSPENSNSNIRFERCSINGFQQHFDFEGTNMASEITHIGCSYGFHAQAFYTLNNMQSVNHRFYGTDIQVGYGDVFYIGSGGGGDIYFSGGSIIMSDDPSKTTFRWVVNSAAGFSPINISGGTRIELRGNYTNLANLPNFMGGRLAFDHCHFLDTATVAKPSWLQVGVYGNISLSRCQIDEGSGLIYTTCDGSHGRYGEMGTILFDDCRLPWKFQNQCSITNNGTIIAQNCQSAGIGAGGYGINPNFTLTKLP